MDFPGAPVPGSWRGALYRPDAPGAVLDSQEWAASWPAFLKAISDPDSDDARRYIRNAMSERVPSEGGFLVPEKLRSEVAAYLTPAIIRPRAMVIPMDAYRVGVPVVDNLTQASGTQALGGLVFALVEEGAGLFESTPEFGRTVLEARKLAAYMQNVSNEFADDAAGGFGAFLARVIALGLAWEEDDLCIQGTGIGEPEGLINTPGAVSVTRANSGQAPVEADIVSMFKALAAPSKQAGLTAGITDVCWLASASVLDALVDLYYLPAGSSPTSGSPVAPSPLLSMGDGHDIAPSLLGLPLAVTDHQPAAGTAGDLVLADLRYYAIGDWLTMTVERSAKGSGFGLDASNYRVKCRIDGRYLIRSTFTTEANQTVGAVAVLH